MTIPHRDTVLIISSELDIDTTVDAIKTQCALDNTQFIYLLEDLLEKADTTLKARDDVYLVRDFAIHQEVEDTFERIAAHHTVTRVVPSDEFALYIAAWLATVGHRLRHSAQVPRQKTDEGHRSAGRHRHGSRNHPR